MKKQRYVLGRELIDGGYCTASELCDWCAQGKLHAYTKAGILIKNLEIKNGFDRQRLEPLLAHKPTEQKINYLQGMFPEKRKSGISGWFIFPFNPSTAACLGIDDREYTEFLAGFKYLDEEVERLVSGSGVEAMPESQPLLPDQSGRVAELEAALADRDGQIAALNARVEELEAANGELEARAAAAETGKEKKLGTLERKSYLRLIAGLANKTRSIDLDARGAAKMLSHEVEKVGLTLSDDVALKIIKEVKELKASEIRERK